MSIENFDCLDDTCVPIAECETVAEDYRNFKNPPSQAVKVGSLNVREPVKNYLADFVR